MVKSKEDVIEYAGLIMGHISFLTQHRDFNNTVNMTADELEKWLKGSASQETGWSKSDDSGESIGHER